MGAFADRPMTWICSYLDGSVVRGTISVEFNWFLPLSRDVSHIGTWPEEGPEPDLDHLTQIVTTVEDVGFSGLLGASSLRNYHDPTVAAAAVLARTRTAEMIVAVRPYEIHPVPFAHQVGTLAQWFPDRVRLSVVAGGGEEARSIGVDDTREERQARLDEWLTVLHGSLYGPFPYSLPGDVLHRHQRADGARPGAADTTRSVRLLTAGS